MKSNLSNTGDIEKNNENVNINESDLITFYNYEEE